MTQNAKFGHSQKSTRESRSVDPDELGNLLNSHLNVKEDDLLHCVSLLLEGLNTPTSLGLYLCLKHKDLAAAVTHEINPNDYIEVGKFQSDWQACKIISKINIAIDGLDPEDKARTSFDECELHCKSENDFWRAYDTFKCDPTPWFKNLLDQARRIVHDIIGDGPDIEEWFNNSRLGPGVVAFGPKSTSDYVKLSEDLSCTEELWTYALPILDCFPGWIGGLSYEENTTFNVKVVRGGKYAQVPKNAKTNRNIETQPLLNGFLQLGLGLTLKRLLKEAGIKLSDQSRNQNLALKGSRTGKLATIDLSNASDMISKGVVSALLPPKWLHALTITRTNEILIERKWRPLHRFSSMGNGYTFELESLIFYAITRAVCGDKAEVSVYGDDIIAPSTKYGEVVQALKAFGFKVNLNKSYAHGPFRESCGKDYFMGVLVRPFFIKEIPSNVPEVIRLVNGLARSAVRHNRGYGFDVRFKRCYRALHQLIPPKLRSHIATGYPEDDSYLVGNTTRDGFKVEYELTEIRPTSWYAAKTALLYRVHKRSVNRTNADEYVGHQSSLTLPQTGGRYVLIPFGARNFERTWPHPMGDPRLPGVGL